MGAIVPYIPAIIAAGGSIISSLLSQRGKDGEGGTLTQGAPMQQQPLVPPGFGDAYGMAGEMAMQRMQEPRHVAPINPLALGAANIASQYYLGQPFQMPGLQQYMPGQGGLGMGGAPGGGGRMVSGMIPGASGQPMDMRSRIIPSIPAPGMPSPIDGRPWMMGRGGQGMM